MQCQKRYPTRSGRFAIPVTPPIVTIRCVLEGNPMPVFEIDSVSGCQRLMALAMSETSTANRLVNIVQAFRMAAIHTHDLQLLQLF